MVVERSMKIHVERHLQALVFFKETHVERHLQALILFKETHVKRFF
jgi:hypothetical protein